MASIRDIQTQDFRTGFQNLTESVLVKKFGKPMGIYTPLGDALDGTREGAQERIVTRVPETERARQLNPDMEQQLANLQAQLQQLTQQVGGTPVKRGPGRPKGSTNKARAAQASAATPVKRGPGRPKGSLNKSTLARLAADREAREIQARRATITTPSGTTEVSAPRRRGRPRKNPQPVEPTQTMGGTVQDLHAAS